uniref:Myosin-9 n=1 Tax=Anthurium amnicola TaxID=1678845 RepID=A0A1D1XWB0_9ARAE
MASSAFRSTTRRSAVGRADDAGSSNRAGAHRRSRSLNGFSGRFPSDGEEPPAPPRGRLVNAAGGLGFPEISLADLADEFFAAAGVGELERGRAGGRPGRRLSDAGFQMDTESSRRRGRSVSRKGSVENSVGVKGVPDGNARRRRSVSVARHRCSDSESYSSTLTDDETRDARENKSRPEKTIRTVYTQKKTEHAGGNGEGNELHEAMRKDVRHAVEEIRTKLEKVIVKMRSDTDCIQPKSAEVFEAIAKIRRNYTTKLEESEKRKQELLGELAAEEQRGQELNKIVRDLFPDTQKSSPSERSSRFRKKSNDRTRMSKHLSKDAEQHFVDFISNVEDADISSFDGDKSDGSSSIGGTKSSATAGIQACCANSFTVLAEVDGLVLPWLDWETSSDSSPLLCDSLSKMGRLLVSGTKLFDSKQEANATHDDSIYFSSHGSWSPNDNDNGSASSKNKLNSRFPDTGVHLNGRNRVGPRESSFQMDDYIHLQHTEHFLFEGLQQRRRIESGGLILCRSFLSS